MFDAVRFATLTRGLARSAHAADLLTQLHEYAVEVSRGRCSVLLQSSPRTGLLHPTSAFGLDRLATAPWMAAGAETRAARAAMQEDQPVFMSNLPAQYPGLAEHLGTHHALLVPLTGLDTHLGLLVIGIAEPAPTAEELEQRVTPVADAFVLAIERLRLQRDADLQRELRGLMHDFSQQISATLSIRAALDSFCHGATRLFGTDRTAVWLHDRTARELRLEASSDPGTAPGTETVPVEDLLHLAALAMRAETPQIAVPEGSDTGIPTIAVGLRGHRRALGTLVLEGTRIEPGEETDILARAGEVGRQLAAIIETTQLLEQVLQPGHPGNVR